MSFRSDLINHKLYTAHTNCTKQPSHIICENVSFIHIDLNVGSLMKSVQTLVVNEDNNRNIVYVLFQKWLKGMTTQLLFGIMYHQDWGK
jgi:hypothetical protein